MKECEGCPVQAVCLAVGRKPFLREHVVCCSACGGYWLKTSDAARLVKRVGLPCMAFEAGSQPVQHFSQCPDCKVRENDEKRRKRRRGGKKFIV